MKLSLNASKKMTSSYVSTLLRRWIVYV